MGANSSAGAKANKATELKLKQGMLYDQGVVKLLLLGAGNVCC